MKQTNRAESIYSYANIYEWAKTTDSRHRKITSRAVYCRGRLEPTDPHSHHGHHSWFQFRLASDTRDITDGRGPPRIDAL